MQGRAEIFRRIERQHFRERLAALGLQAVDGMVVRLLAREGQMRQEDIAHRIVMDKGAVARAVARLEKRGLVLRAVRDQCRREKLVSITDSGRQTALTIQQVMEEWNEISWRGFTPEERAQCDAFLTRMTENVIQFKRGEEAGNG